MIKEFVDHIDNLLVKRKQEGKEDKSPFYMVQLKGNDDWEVLDTHGLSLKEWSNLNCDLVANWALVTDKE